MYIRIEFKTHFTDVEEKCALAAASQGKWMNKINLSKELYCSVKTDIREMRNLIKTKNKNNIEIVKIMKSATS